MTDAAGRVIARARNPQVAGDDLSGNPLVLRVLQTEKPQAGTIILSAESLLKEGPDLAELRRVARRQVAIALERLEGVAEARVVGGRELLDEAEVENLRDVVNPSLLGHHDVVGLDVAVHETHLMSLV